MIGTGGGNRNTKASVKEDVRRRIKWVGTVGNENWVISRGGVTGDRDEACMDVGGER